MGRRITSLLRRGGRLASGGSDPGKKVLQSLDAWIDAEQSTLTTVDVSGAIDLRVSPAFALNVTAANITGPDSEDGVALSESDGVTGSHVYRWPVPSNFSFGYVDIRYRVKAAADAQEDHLAAEDLDRWRAVYSDSGTGSTYLIQPDNYNDDVVPVFLNTGGTDVDWARDRSTGFSLTEAGGDWLDVRFETQRYGTGSTFGPQFRTSSNITGKNSVFAEVASIEYRQSRVSAITDTRDATERFTQATNDSRMVVAPDYWLGDSKALVESWNRGAGQTPLADASATPVTVMGVFHVRNVKPVAASRVIQVGDVALQAGTDGQWHLIQGGSDEDLGVNVAAVPVAIALRITGGTAEVFIDGQSIGSASYTQGGTGLTVLGDRAAGAVRSLAHTSAALSDSEIASASATLRTQASLPAKWPLVIWAGQSNATHTATWKQEVAGNGLRSVPGFAHRFEEGTSTSTVDRWITGPHMDAVLPDAGFNNQTGSSHGWLKEAVDAANPQAVICTAQGGRSITSWLSGEEQYLHTRAVVDASIADFGTHLVEVDSWVWIQGEADTATTELAGAYLANLRTVRTWVRDKWGSQVKWVGLRLHGDYSTASGPEQGTIRTAQDTFAAEDAATVYTDPTATTDLGGDEIHYENPHDLREVGRLLYVARQTL